MADTRTDLVKRLYKLPPCAQRDDLIVRARAGEFHDFKSESATPKMDLTKALAALATQEPTSKLAGMATGCAAISVDVMAGKFDETWTRP